jgi:hypothetical protein
MKTPGYKGFCDLGPGASIEEAALLAAAYHWMSETSEGRAYAVKAGIAVGTVVTAGIVLKLTGADKALKRMALRQAERIAIRMAKNRFAKIALEVGEEVITAIRRARVKAGGRMGDCETACRELADELKLPYTQAVVPKGGRGFDHMVVYFKDKVLDPTAAQYVKPGAWTWEGLEKAGLRDAVKTGVFGKEQHEAFLRGIAGAAAQAP